MDSLPDEHREGYATLVSNLSILVVHMDDLKKTVDKSQSPLKALKLQ